MDVVSTGWWEEKVSDLHVDVTVFEGYLYLRGRFFSLLPTVAYLLCSRELSNQTNPPRISITVCEIGSCCDR